jgi:hypothetical protein
MRDARCEMRDALGHVILIAFRKQRLVSPVSYPPLIMRIQHSHQRRATHCASRTQAAPSLGEVFS